MRAVLQIAEQECQPSSPLKRKLESDRATGQMQLRLRRIKRVNSSALVNVNKGFLFPTSDMLLQRGGGLVLVRDVMHMEDTEVVSLVSEDCGGIQIGPSMCALNHLEGNWRELVGASSDGHVFSAVIDDDGHITTMLHENLIRSEKSLSEHVTTIFHAGDVYVLGTDTGDVLVVSREGGSSVARLLRPQGLFSIVKSRAAFILGYTDTAVQPTQGKRGIVNLFSLPSQDRDMLLSVGVERITLWADWCQPRGHKILWERDIRELLSNDIRQVLSLSGNVAESCGAGYGGGEASITSCQALDAILVPIAKPRTSGLAVVAAVAVLSACAVSSTEFRRGGSLEPKEVGEGDVCSLWVHIVEICGDGEGGYHTVRARFMIEAGLPPQCCGWAAPALHEPSTSMQPKLYLSKDGKSSAADFYVSWESTDKCLSLANCDLSVLDSNATDSSSSEFCQTPRCHYISDMTTDRIISVNVVDSLLLRDGVSIVRSDGVIMHASVYPLPFSAMEIDLAARTDDVSRLSEEWVELLLACSQDVVVAADVTESHQNSHMVLEDGLNLLPQFSVLPLSSACNDQLLKLRGYFAAASEKAAEECAVAASTIICQRLPVGHSWGEDSLNFNTDRDGVYDLVRTSLREKCVAHMKLMWVLLSSRAWDSFPSIREAISRHDSYLKGSLGMCLSLAESQAKRLSQPGLNGGVAWFLAVGHGELLETTLAGMSKAVDDMPGKEEFGALGLRTTDSFFSQTLQLSRGLFYISTELSQRAANLHRSGRLVPCAYAMVSFFLSVLQSGDIKLRTPKQTSVTGLRNRLLNVSEYMSSEVPCSISFNNDVRTGVQLILGGMRQGLSLQPAEGSHIARSKYLASVGWRREVEGQRVIMLCSALLQTFVDELNYLNSGRISAAAAADARELDISYNNAKEVCVDVLFLLGHTSDAFELAVKHIHFRGLLEAAAQDDSLGPKLYDTIRQHGNEMDPRDGSIPLGLFALNFFEQGNNVSMILEYSKVIDKAQLNVFFGAHPELAWIYSILRNSGAVSNDMTAAARAALLHSQTQTGVATASALLSISKLSAVLALATAKPSNVSEDSENSATGLFRGAVSNLAVIRALEVAVEEGAISSDGNTRLDAEQVLDSLLDFIRHNFLAGNNKNSSQDGLEDDRAVRHEKAVNMMAAALAVTAELLNDSEVHIQRLLSFWALAIEYDRDIWYALGKPETAVNELNEQLTACSLKNTMVAIISQSAFVDVELGKLSPAILPNSDGGYILQKSVAIFFAKIGERDGMRQKQLTHIICMAAR